MLLKVVVCLCYLVFLYFVIDDVVIAAATIAADVFVVVVVDLASIAKVADVVDASDLLAHVVVVAIDGYGYGYC